MGIGNWGEEARYLILDVWELSVGGDALMIKEQLQSKHRGLAVTKRGADKV